MKHRHCAAVPLAAVSGESGSARKNVVYHLRRLLVGLALLGAGALSAQAQGYPEKGRVIKIVAPSGPGSAVDLLARAYEKAMSEVAAVNAIVENKAGAEGVLGVQSFLTLPADGYSMLFVSSSQVALNPVMLPNIQYDPLKDLLPLVTISRAGLVMNLGTSTPFKTAREFVAAARGTPGKYTCATASTTQRMACELLQASADIKLLIVPYKTTAAAMLAVAGGETDVIFVDAGSVMSQWSTGRVRGVAVTTAERLRALPELATAREQGMPDFLMSAWYGIYFKAGTQPSTVAAMRSILRKAASRPSVTETLRTFVHEPLDLSGEDIAAMNRREIETWSKLVRERGISLN